MKTKKITNLILASTMVLSIGASTMAGTKEVSAATVISESTYKTITAFSTEDLTKATGISLTTANVQKMYNKLKQAATWEKLGYKADQAKKISQRVTISSNQTQGILKNLVNTLGMQLKVVLVQKANYEGVNLGSVMVNSSTPEVQVPETETPEVEVPETEGQVTGLDGRIKEIDIELEYKAKNQDIDLELDVKNDGKIKAEYENEATKQKVEGDVAKAVAINIFNGIEVKNMTEAQISNHVTNKLGANKNFKKFSFKVKYFDGSKVDFKIK